MELQTERLLLREFTMDDFAAVHSFASDVRIAEYVDWGPNTTGETQEFLDMCLAAQRGAVRTNISSLSLFPAANLLAPSGSPLNVAGASSATWLMLTTGGTCNPVGPPRDRSVRDIAPTSAGKRRRRQGMLEKIVMVAHRSSGS